MCLGSPAPQAQCPGSAPVFPDQANQNPQYLQQCFNLPPGGGCPQPPPPGIVPGSTRAQEVQLTTQVPAGFTANEVWVAAYYYDDLGFLQEHWIHKSIQGAPHPPGKQLVVGAPGLKEATEMMFAISFRGSSAYGPGVFCWSDWTHETTLGFSGSPPIPPPGVAQLVEDTFSRPPTDPSCGPGTLGDGLGPQDVWLDCADEQAGHVVRIGEYCDTQSPSNCVTAAYSTPSANMLYAGVVPDQPHNYVQALTRIDLNSNPGGMYNLQVQAWGQMGVVGGSNILKTYNAKLMKGWRGCTDPTLFLVALPHEYEITKCVDLDGDGDADPDPNLPPGAAIECTGDPPLDVADPTYPTVSQPVWLRIEVWEDLDSHKPVIKGTVAWGNCAAGQGIENCEHVCTQTRPDTSALDPDDILHAGAGGVFFHEKPYYVDRFDLGSE